MTWEEVIAHCDAIQVFTTDERNDVKAAYRFLESKFGMSLLAFEHPFSRQIANRAPWTRKWARVCYDRTQHGFAEF